jgi:sialic acid synthase SpsE/sugar phosphate isomerase/epimerase
MKNVTIGKKIINENNPVYIIAEIGVAHQGDMAIAKKLINTAVEAGCDCVKFQKRSLKKLYREEVLNHPEGEEQGISYLLDHLAKKELGEKDIIELQNYSKEKNIDFACTPWDTESLNFLDNLNLPFIKIASPDMTNLPLILSAIRSHRQRPLLISTGMSYLSEIEQVVKLLEEQEANFILLHCNSTYPAPYQDINLNFIKILNEKFNRPVGYSGHEIGTSVPLAAVALGAKVIEKHITLDRSWPGPDHKVGLLPEELKKMVFEIRSVEKALGEQARFISRGEYINRQGLGKSLVTTRDIKKGEILTYKDIDLKSPGKGTSPLKLDYFIGKKLVKRDIFKDDYLLESDVGATRPKSGLENLKMNHHWGVVARPIDIEELLPCQSDFIEIHYTDKDINQPIKLSGIKYDRDLVIHGPEYDDDFLIDLSSPEKNVRDRSIAMINKTLNQTRQIKNLFKNGNEKIKTVIHPGGMSMNSPLPNETRELNENLLDSLQKIESDGFELLIENMPPYPWYFGGTWHHKSFMDAEEIAEFSKKTGYGIVLDISHAALYCNFAQKSLNDYIKTILPYVKYLHVSDAAGTGGEGLQIGDGVVDFKMVLEHLTKTDLWFLPEIWQGHKFGGEGFCIALNNLKGIDNKI